jgi:hypothetical protein
MTRKLSQQKQTDLAAERWHVARRGARFVDGHRGQITKKGATLSHFFARARRLSGQ